MRILFFTLFVVLLSGCQTLALDGKVLDFEGKPISDALIVNQRSGRPVAEIRSDSTGRFILDSMRLNDTIMVLAPGFQTETTVFDYTLTRYPKLTFWLKRKD
jgi:hypothetical protein